MAVFLAEAVQLVFGEPSFEEGAGVDTGRRVALDEDLVAAARVVLTAEEVVEAHFVERRRRRVGGDVPADADSRALCAVHHDGGIPADESTEVSLDFFIAGKPRLILGRDGVDVVGGGQRGDRDVTLAGALE